MIVHIGSNAARLPLANQMGVHNIRVNLVSPGVIESAALGRRLQQLADENNTDIATARNQFASSFDIPLGRVGSADDVAELVTFLAASDLTQPADILDVAVVALMWRRLSFAYLISIGR